MHLTIKVRNFGADVIKIKEDLCLSCITSLSFLAMEVILSSQNQKKIGKKKKKKRSFSLSLSLKNFLALFILF